MQEQLDFIQLQLWIVMVLFAVFAAANVLNYLCAQKKSKRNDDEPDFSLMFQLDQFDVLIDESQQYLKTYPNNLNALYFGARALIARGRLTEAKSSLEKIVVLEPLLAANLKDDIDSCSNAG